MLENDENFLAADIVVTPPIDGDISDEDSGPEDRGGTIDNLPRNLLQAEGHMTVFTGTGKYNISDDEADSTIDEPSRTVLIEKQNSAVSDGPLIDGAGFTVKKPPARKRRKKLNSNTIPADTSPTTDEPCVDGADITLKKPPARKRQKTLNNDSVPADTSAMADKPSPSADDAVKSTVKKRPVTQRQKKSHDDSTQGETSSHNEPVPCPDRKWITKDVSTVQPEWNGSKPDFLEQDMAPTYLFECFWDDEVITHIVEMSKLYATQKGKANFCVTPEEVRGTLAILLLSGYVPLPARRMFWEPTEDVANAAVTSMMSLNRFEEILRYLHLADNSCLPAGDKMAKVRPLYNMMNQRFVQYSPTEQHINVDESMVPYFGRHSSKQFIRGKPIRFGFKVWCLNTRLGYLLQCDPYQGKDSYLDRQFGLGGSVVRFLLSKLPKLNYCVYIDNYFTSLRLLDQLRRDNVAAVGTIRANRIENCPVKDVQLMKKVERGNYDQRTDKSTGTTVVRWQDNSVVTIASNTFGITPLGQAKRWSAAKKAEISVTQPHLIAKYNYGMGETDRMDQNIQSYRISIRLKKWWWQLFTFMLDVAVQNAWLLYRLTPAHAIQPMSLLQFRRSIVQSYVVKYRSRVNIGRPVGRSRPLDKRVPTDARFDGKDHYIQPHPTQRRCSHCGMKAKTVCSKCQVAVHDRCFRDFHTN